MATTTATLTGEQFDALSYDEGRQWELLNGELIPVSSLTLRHQKVVYRILAALNRYLESTNSRNLATQDVEFSLADDCRFRPDVAVLTGSRAASADLDHTPIPGAPDIAIEVISPSERTTDSQEKVRAYLQHGTAEVWQVYPKSRTVQIHRAEITHTIEGSGMLSTPLLPDFTLPVAALFE